MSDPHDEFGGMNVLIQVGCQVAARSRLFKPRSTQAVKLSSQRIHKLNRSKPTIQNQTTQVKRAADADAAQAAGLDPLAAELALAEARRALHAVRAGRPRCVAVCVVGVLLWLLLSLVANRG
jgi:hypothetical protein